MYITNNNIRYPCKGRRQSADTVVFTGVKGLPEDVAGPIGLYSDDNDFELAQYDTGDWLRVEVRGETLTLANLPEPEPVEEAPEIEPGISEIDMLMLAVAELYEMIIGG